MNRQGITHCHFLAVLNPVTLAVEGAQLSGERQPTGDMRKVFAEVDCVSGWDYAHAKGEMLNHLRYLESHGLGVGKLAKRFNII